MSGRITVRSPTSPSRSLGSSRSGKALAVCSASADKLASWLNTACLRWCSNSVSRRSCCFRHANSCWVRSLMAAACFFAVAIRASASCAAAPLLCSASVKGLGANPCGFGEVSLEALCRFAVILGCLGKQRCGLLLRLVVGGLELPRSPVPARLPAWIWLLRPRAQQSGAGSQCRGRHSGESLAPRCRPPGVPTRLAAGQPRSATSRFGLGLVHLGFDLIAQLAA